MDISDNTSDSFLKERFNLELKYTKKSIEDASVATYTKSYETWKRISNITKYFKEEIIKKSGEINILDIGCSTGYYLFLFNKQFKLENRANLYGIDSSISEIHFAKALSRYLNTDNIAFDVGDAQNLGFPENHFDIIICCELIEHLAWPQNCLKEIMRILKPGGLAVLTTPNKDNAVKKIGLFLGYLFRKERENSFDDNSKVVRAELRHISVKGIKEWKKIICASGLKIEGISRGGIFSGGHRYDGHPILFGMTLILDTLLDHLPFTLNITENVTFKLRKPETP